MTLQSISKTFPDGRTGKSLMTTGLAVLVVALMLGSALVNPLPTFLVLAGGLLALLVLGQVERALWLIVLATPFETFLNVSFSFTKLGKLTLVLLFTSLIFLERWGGTECEKAKLPDPYKIPLILFLAAGIPASLLAPSPLRSVLGFGSLAIFVLYYWSLRRFRGLTGLGPGLLRMVVLLGLPTAVLALLQLSLGYGGILGSSEQRAEEDGFRMVWPEVLRGSGTFNGPNAAGAFLAIAALTAFLHAAVVRHSRKKYWIFGALSVVGLLATFSRGALLGFLVGLGFSVWRLGYFRIRWRFALATSLAITSIGVLISSDDARAYFRLGTDLISTSESRFDAWQATLTIIRRNPVTGIGFYGFQEIAQGIEGSSDATIHPHNGFLKAFVEEGPLGGIAYLLLVGGFLRVIFRPICFARGSTNEWVWISIASAGVCLFTQELFDAGFTNGGSSIAILFATLLGLQVQMLKLVRTTVPPSILGAPGQVT